MSWALFWDESGAKYLAPPTAENQWVGGGGQRAEFLDLEREIALLNEELTSAKQLMFCYANDIDNLERYGGFVECCWAQFLYFGGNELRRRSEIERCQYCILLTWQGVRGKRRRLAFLEGVQSRLFCAAPPPRHHRRHNPRHNPHHHGPATTVMEL